MINLLTSLKKLIGRIEKMPSCKKKTWKNITFQLLPRDGDIIRNIVRFIPYFWGNEIYLDLNIAFPQRKGFVFKQADIPDEKWDYYWELCGKNRKVLCKGKDILKFDTVKKTKKRWVRIYNAVKIGEEQDLNEGKYRIYITFEDGRGGTSDRMFFTSFSIRNKEDYLSAYLLPAIIALVISLIVAYFK